ncbi:alpha-L-rhamnosidase-related protein [Paenibacillus mendelii]|uniref:Alpha-L-rhamnosidase C-terminal domain-containing protein n=1 Tax=Paenibacillus mendelii TaxID=206163 RepID=A0ABV6J4R5_9BACL|nr:alpha-L-rhamnosidase C-terminal domain-containing protein [Paenibacillus mendelii]MCQ6562842.1 alpha-rhamnosidase [Paenibacillus mendelii]
MSNQQSKATWIWYPDDYELWLHASVSVKRQFRGYICPPFWRLDTAYSNVSFRKTFELEKPERLTLSVQGMFVLHMDGSMTPTPYERTPVTSVLLPAGKHELTVKVYNDRMIPAVYAEGETIVSDGSWEVTCYDAKWVKAASSNLNDIAYPPADFRFAYQSLEPVSVTHIEGATLLDFGRETFGCVRFEGMAGKGKLRLYYGESLGEAMAGEEAETFDELEIAHDRPQLFVTPVTRAFRYIQLQADEGLSWEAVTHDYEYLPLERRGSFRCSDERINQIWDVSVYTLHLNTREFMYDGMKRDRWVWSGDAYQSFLMNNYVFFDQDVTKRTLIALRGKDPVQLHLNTIMDYTFYWFIAYYDYFMATGDLSFVEASYPKMLSLMDFCLNRRNGEGFMEGHPEDWVFIDWADMDNRGEVAAEQLLFCRSLETMAIVAKELGDLENGERFHRLATELRTRIFELFWDEDQGGLIHGRLDGQLNKRILKYPNMFALRLDYLNDDQKQLVRENVMLNASVQKIKTPYMRFYELEAMCEIGELDYVLREMRDYWGGMLDLGATTFWEEYDPALPIEEQYHMYGDKYRKSLCHAWGAAPIYLLGKYTLGIQPQAPGFSRYLVEPKLGDLDWIEGTVPTPDGEIKVFMNQTRLSVVTNRSGIGLLRFTSTGRPSVNEGELRLIGHGRYELELPNTDYRYEIMLCQENE